MTDPLFVADIATLKSALRLSGVPTDGDAHVMVQSALMQVRAGFYSRLGLAKVAALVAITPSANPTSTDPILRGIAQECETIWVRCLLLDRLATFYMDSSGAYQELLNQEGISRSMTPGAIAEQRKRCMTQIEEWLAILNGDVELGDGPDVQVYTQGDQTPRVFPNGTLSQNNRRLFGDPTREID
jgi:hypothetical protein